MRMVVFVLSLAMSCGAMSCENFEIPITTTGQLDGEDWSPTAERIGTLMVVAPKEFRGAHLLDAHILFGDNSVSIAKREVDEMPGAWVFYVNGGLGFFKDSHVLVQYRTAPQVDEQGNKSTALCRYSQTVQWDL